MPENQTVERPQSIAFISQRSGQFTYFDIQLDHAYHTALFMQRQFPHSEIRPPASGETQHCCLVRQRA